MLIRAILMNLQLPFLEHTGPCVPTSVCEGMGNSTTCNPGGPTCWTECNGTVGTPKPCHDAPSEASPYTRFPTYMTYSKHPLGPYSKPVMVYSGSDRPGGSVSTGDTNMAGVIFADGSLVGMWRGDRKSATVKPNVVQYEYGMRASNWKDPTTYTWGYAVAANNIFPQLVGKNETRTCGIEDPSLYVDPTNGIVHAVVHNWKGGGHAASADNGKTWRWYGGNCSANAGSSSLDWSRSVWSVTPPPQHTSLVKTRRYCWTLCARFHCADDAQQYRLGAVRLV